MKILITGNMGYLGPVLVRHLRRARPGATLCGFDTGFFGHCLTDVDRAPESMLNTQHFGDVRNFPVDLLRGVAAVVHLAAISNDPMGNKFEGVTSDINAHASVAIANAARDAGVKSFVFASSCSMYGVAEGGAKKEVDSINPLTAYARSKVATEVGLKGMDLGGMNVTCLRFATACGMSDRLRLDLVLNDFVACALASKEISVLSDGSPWRPLIDVKDMARAIDWAIDRPRENGGQFLAVNAGSDRWNYQVKDLAIAVAAAIPGTGVTINTNAPPDKRSYKVDFSLFSQLAPKNTPIVDLEQSIDKLKDGLAAMGFANPDFRNSSFMRLKVLEKHMADGRLTDTLRWA
jgi:nucleoside-diphosphate-sugar epimerase